LENKKFISNPFFAYVLVYSFVFLLYILPFSNLYPSIEIDFFVFFVVTILFSLFLYKYFKINNYIEEKVDSFSNCKIKYVMILFFILYTLDFIYMGAIPLFSPADIEGYRGYDGIPVLHVLIITGNAFFSNIIFEKYAISKKKIFLLIWIISLIPYVLIFTRGSIVVSCISAVLIFFSYNVLKKKYILFTIFIGIFVLYVFGVAGNIRLNQQLYGESINDSETILTFGQATEEFQESLIPKEFFWGYIYISSPLANLQNIINQRPNIELDTNNIEMLVITEYLPDTISKRILEYMNIDSGELEPPLITHAFNVSTFYAGSANILGLFGMILIYLYYIILSIVYCSLLMRNNKYKIIGIVTFTTLVYLSIFSNVFAFSGWSFQLLYPLIFGYKWKI